VVVNKRGKNAFLRAAFQVYNDASDIDRLSDALSLEL
jgi:selenocysteine lyase/cysteine desulfurase